MNSDIKFFLTLLLSFLPFILFVFLNSIVNVKKEERYKQYVMPVIALIYGIIALIFMDDITVYFMEEYAGTAGQSPQAYEDYSSSDICRSIVLFNTMAMSGYIVLKRVLTFVVSKLEVHKGTFAESVVDLCYVYDEQSKRWFIKSHYGQARTFIKTVYYSICILSVFVLMTFCIMVNLYEINVKFSPVFAILLIGEIAYWLDGSSIDEAKSDVAMNTDRSKHMAMYPLLRTPLRMLFGDKLSAEGTTVNEAVEKGGSTEDILVDMEENGGHIGKNYAAFIRRKMECGLKPNVDFVRTGYDLAIGKSLLFNTPFYYKLNPYVFYAMNRNLLTGGKVLIVLGRHGTEADLSQWCEQGMQEVSNIPSLWKLKVLNDKKYSEDEIPDIGIISRSGVHDLDIHKNNLPFLKKVSFVVIIEPSRLVTTAQLGLNLLIKCCDTENNITFCSIDRNCDGLVDALSHILMVNISEVSATEYPHGMSSYMYWTADEEHLQHRILPGVSRYLGMGTELSAVALRNQVKMTIWYGGDAFPVKDIHWIAKQYYHDLLEYAQLPADQETFDKRFQTSFNMCNEKVDDFSYITVEDDRNNLFEVRRNFATIAEEQGFVNVISPEYLLREYMASNATLFTADAKAIPYISADYARTKRNAILSLCMLMCVDSIKEEVLRRQLLMLHLDTQDPISEVWKEVYTIFRGESQIELDRNGVPILTAKTAAGKFVSFEKDNTILFKRAYCMESGNFESVYTIENKDFIHIILDDLQNASYIAEEENKDAYIGTELKGHVYQKYLPGQFFTLNGKYYEMISTTADNRILVRRASDHIDGRLVYKQIRNYTIHQMTDSDAMGALKTVNNIDIHYQFADFSVETPGYWKLGAYNDFDNGDLVTVNGVPAREYHHKQILKLDFSKLGDQFTDSIRMTLTNLMNEVFITLFADNQPFISAVTEGNYNAPLTYSLYFDDNVESSAKCIYIIEDSQLDIGLLIAVERNINRILQIISDYLIWNEEKINEGCTNSDSVIETTEAEPLDLFEESELEEKQGILAKILKWFAKLMKKDTSDGGSQGTESEESLTEENIAEDETSLDTELQEATEESGANLQIQADGEVNEND